MLSKTGAMSNPHEYEEIMRAAFQFGTTKTVEQVVAEQEARHEAAEQERKRKIKPRSPLANNRAPKAPTVAPAAAVPKQSEVDKVRALLAINQPKPAAETPAE